MCFLFYFIMDFLYVHIFSPPVALLFDTFSFMYLYICFSSM